MSGWIPYKEVDFSDEKFVAFSVDTRDFHCVPIEKTESDYWKNVDLHKTRKCPNKYFHTPEEIKELLDRYYTESGGEGEWRMFCLDGEARDRTLNWEMKYIRILRYPQGLIVTIRDAFSNNRDALFVMGKHMLASPVHQKYLNHH